LTQTYSALTDAQRALVEQANAVLAADETAVHAYGMVIQLSILIVSFGVLSGYLLLEFLVPRASVRALYVWVMMDMSSPHASAAA